MVKKLQLDVIRNFKKVHGDRYNYNKVKYVNMNTKVIITCHKHGDFKQLPSSHIFRKNNCPKCGKIETAKHTIKKIDDLLEDFKKVHGDRYSYNKVKYINMNTNVIITCHKHGDFKQLPLNHSHSKSGCPKCHISKGAHKIMMYFNNRNITYEIEKRFKDCKNTRTLPFDFYLTYLNICIEYDGLQHFKESSLFGGLSSLNKIRCNDQIKNDYCQLNNIKLIRIRFYDDIEAKLNWFLQLKRYLNEEF